MTIHEPVLQMRSNAVLIYYTTERTHSRKFISFRSANLTKQRGTQYSGYLTAGAKKRLARAITLLVQSIKPLMIYNETTKRACYHRLSFITLTIPFTRDAVDAKSAYTSLLSHFLQWLRRSAGCSTYIWKAELTKKGQLHYHITTPSYIHHPAIRKKWNYLLRKAGLLDSFAAKHGHYNPNSTDIHEVKKIHDMASYLVKEIAKGCQNEKKINGKVWDCSDNLAGAKYFSVPMTADHDKFLRLCKENKLARFHTDDRYTLVKFHEPPEEHLLSADELRQFELYLHDIINRI